jgi:uncharacterized coiled-coil protein SlyX
LQHKAYETELEESIAELEALNTLQGGTLEDVKKDFAKKLAQTETEQTNLLTLLDKAQGQSGQSKIQVRCDTLCWLLRLKRDVRARTPVIAPLEPPVGLTGR